MILFRIRKTTFRKASLKASLQAEARATTSVQSGYDNPETGLSFRRSTSDRIPLINGDICRCPAEAPRSIAVVLLALRSSQNRSCRRLSAAAASGRTKDRSPEEADRSPGAVQFRGLEARRRDRHGLRDRRSAQFDPVASIVPVYVVAPVRNEILEPSTLPSSMGPPAAPPPPGPKPPPPEDSTRPVSVFPFWRNV